jgi:hypothetical protein
MASAELSTLLERLAASGVEFVLVGGLAAVAQGAPITTFDVDIVPRRTPENIERLLQLLAGLGARYRGRLESPLPPSRTALLGPGHSLFETDLGPLDVLGAIEGGRGYDELLPDTLLIDLGGQPLRLLSLDALVRLKRASPDAKDKLRLPVLEATLRKQRSPRC